MYFYVFLTSIVRAIMLTSTLRYTDNWFLSYLKLVLVPLGGVRLSPLGKSATVGLLYQPRMIDDDYGAVGGLRIGRGNRSTRRKPARVPLCPPQILHDLTWNRTRAAAVGSQWLTAWAMARPLLLEDSFKCGDFAASLFFYLFSLRFI
jgi:hypothetical protein